MITDNNQEDIQGKWHYIALKGDITDDGYKKPINSISKLFRVITSNNNGDFYCLGCLHSFRTNKPLKKHERLCNKHDYCEIVMPTEDKNILKYNHREKSLKVANIIYLDTESLLIKIQPQQNNNPQESYTKRNAIHEICGYSLNLVRSYDSNKNIYSFYRGTDCAKKLCKDLKDQAMEIINFKEKKMIPLTDSEIKHYEKRKYCHICKRKFCTDENDKNKFKLYYKVRNHDHYTGKYRGAAHSICNLRYKVQREIPVVLHNGSNYDYHLIIKKLTKEFEGKVDCLEENTEKYITFSVPLKKINKNGKLITYKLKFIDSYRFMQTSLSNLTDNLSEIDNKDCKNCMERNKIKSDCKYIKHKKNKLIYKCKKCNDISAKPINRLIVKFSNTYKFCNKDLDKFILLSRKGVYPYEYMDSWEKFNETKLTSKKDFYNNFYLEDITDEDYNHAQKYGIHLE